LDKEGVIPQIDGWGRDRKQNFKSLYQDGYEPQTRRLIVSVLRSGMTMVDLGAHLGFYTILGAHLVGRLGRVWSFEPDDMYFRLLTDNVNNNGVAQQVTLNKYAIAEEDRVCKLFLGKGNSSSLFRGPNQTDATQTVQAVSLDSFFTRIGNGASPQVDLLKMDIEGAEPLAIRGMRHLINNNPRLVLIAEVNPFFLTAAGSSVEEMFDLLAESGLRKIRALREECRQRIYDLSKPKDVNALKELAHEQSYLNISACTV
jgi:FkbM family methyltransferase